MLLVRRLHPTPAVAGRPTDAALNWIRTHETFERGLYAGPVGWFDAQGDGQFDVALRSGVIRGAEITVFGGAGLVKGSEPAKEFDETTQKMQVLLGSVCFASDAARG
jgi:isochorismate synthase EntC